MSKIKQKYLFRAKFYFSDVWIYGGGVWQYPEGCKMIGEDRHGEIIIKEVKPETVCQMLMIDARGEKMFEGDVFEVKIGSKWGGRYLASIPRTFMIHNEKRVIGNIFDNPKLNEGIEHD